MQSSELTQLRRQRTLANTWTNTSAKRGVVSSTDLISFNSILVEYARDVRPGGSSTPIAVSGEILTFRLISRGNDDSDVFFSITMSDGSDARIEFNGVLISIHNSDTIPIPPNVSFTMRFLDPHLVTAFTMSIVDDDVTSEVTLSSSLTTTNFPELTTVGLGNPTGSDSTSVQNFSFLQRIPLQTIGLAGIIQIVSFDTRDYPFLTDCILGSIPFLASLTFKGNCTISRPPTLPLPSLHTITIYDYPSPDTTISSFFTIAGQQPPFPPAGNIVAVDKSTPLDGLILGIQGSGVM